MTCKIENDGWKQEPKFGLTNLGAQTQSSTEELECLTITTAPYNDQGVPNVILLLISFPPEKMARVETLEEGGGSYVFGTHSHGH